MIQMKRSLDEEEAAETKLPRPSLAFGWQTDYRATHVVEMSNTQSIYPEKVIFHPTSSSWNLTDPVNQFCSEENFKKTVDGNCGMFDMSSEWAPGTELKKLLTEANYKCETAMGPHRSTQPITTTPSTPAMDQLFGLLRNSLADNTSNGPTKIFFKELLDRMLQDLSATGQFYVENPVASSLSISQYILMDEDEYVPGSPESPTSSVQEEVKHFIVPGVIVYDIFDKYFALNMEIKRPGDNTGDALVKCFTQMLCHMHTQNIHFGVVVSAKEWVLIMAIKLGDKIFIRQFQRSMYLVASPGTDNLPVHLDVDAFISLVNWMYRILSWNMHG
ncbi:PREDICTED: uncharacterized protein LOC106817601 [Priapulus caudatus]|uniref:Uncharacterized protein LOC106817601 n=1 Tax=Priapulus caudatus TaxID=37621 RepID=A0ABM1EZZ6_PRICU|nr:PREDICTED: uncharacterized protein LOC106817601 [Priapulus caudatus]